MRPFKVGDRVRVVRIPASRLPDLLRMIGAEGTVTHVPPRFGLPGDCEVLLDGHPGVVDGYTHPDWRAMFWQLAPVVTPLVEIPGRANEPLYA